MNADRSEFIESKSKNERERMNRYKEDEKKVEDLTYLEDIDDDHFADYRLQRLERQLDLLSTELLHVKQQQVKGKNQLLDLQADLVAAELARQAAEEQLAHQQRHDHELLISFFRKFMEKEHSHHEIPTVIDVTKYSDTEGEGHPDEDDVPTNALQLSKALQELSLAVQQHSSDQLQHREALELAWMNFKSEQSERLQHVEDESDALYEGLKDMAMVWDQKLHEMNTQIQTVKKIVSSQNISSLSTEGPTLAKETAEKVRTLSTDMAQLQQSIQRNLDSNRRINGERIVTKRKTESDLRAIRQAIKRLASVVFELAEKLEKPSTAANASVLEPSHHIFKDSDAALCEEPPIEDEIGSVVDETEVKLELPLQTLESNDSAHDEEEPTFEEHESNVETHTFQLHENYGSQYVETGSVDETHSSSVQDIETTPSCLDESLDPLREGEPRDETP
jgi:hypothetical protein